MQTFFIILCKGYEHPAHNRKKFFHHLSEEGAKEEAIRLSKLHPDKSFRVCKAIGQAKNGGEWADAESNYLN